MCVVYVDDNNIIISWGPAEYGTRIRNRIRLGLLVEWIRLMADQNRIPSSRHDMMAGGVG